MNKIVYKGTSNLEFLQSLFFRAAFILTIIYLIFIYEENPPVIIIATLLCFLFFIFIGNDEIIIYSDRFIQTDTSIARAFSKSKGKIYAIKDIKAASLPEETKPGIADIGIILVLASILPRRVRVNTKRRIYLDLKNGETITILSSLGQNKMKEIVETINSLV